MTAIPLHSKSRRASGGVAMLSQWIARAQRERFTVEASVTPEMAAMLLERNAENRPHHQGTVESYAAAMRRGEWHLNGQNIIISDTGELNDGQHRLMAVIEADEPVALGFQFGVSRESRATLDQGRKRTLGDHFAMAGHQHWNALAAATRLAWCYDNRIWSMSQGPTVEQALSYVEQNPGIHDYLRVGARIGSQFSTSGAQIAFALYVCSRISREGADQIAAQVHDGLGLTAANMPAARVRERLIQHATGRVPLRRNEPSAILIKAFNAHHTGRRMRALSWTAAGAQAENFPIAGA